MRLAAAELGGHVEDGRCLRFRTRHPADRFGSDRQQALGEVGLAKEPRRVLVVRIGPAVAHLVEMHGELRCIEWLSFSQVFPRVDDFVPGL